MSLAVIVPAVLFILVAMLVVGIAKALCLGKSTSFATEAKSADELARLIVKEEHYEAEADGGSAFRKDKNKWTADVVTGSYTAIGLCCADPCTNDVRTVVAVVDPEVTQEAIARFVLLADQSKMDRSSSKSQQLNFVSPANRLRRAALSGTSSSGSGFELFDNTSSAFAQPERASSPVTTTEGFATAGSRSSGMMMGALPAVVLLNIAVSAVVTTMTAPKIAPQFGTLRGFARSVSVA